MTKQSPLTPQLMMVLLILAMLWGSASVGIKLALAGFTPGHLTLFRQLMASLCFVPFLLLSQNKLFPQWQDLPFLFVLGCLGYAIYHMALNYGEIKVNAGTASLIIATAPAFTAIFAVFLLSDRLTVLGWLGLVVSMVNRRR